MYQELGFGDVTVQEVQSPATTEETQVGILST